LQKILKPPITRINTDIKESARKAFAARMGQEKPKTPQASLIDFSFFLPIPACWDHLTRSFPLSRPSGCNHAVFLAHAQGARLWLVFLQMRPARELLTIKYAAFI
jgi:hypothetical protein